MRFLMLALIASALAVSQAFGAPPKVPLKDIFQDPPDEAKPWVYWFWLNGNITAEGITADLEAMARVGIGGALIMEVDQGIPRGSVDFMSDAWRGLFKHAVAEAGRLGLEINMNNDAGWNGSGGPWVTPENAMQKVVYSETLAAGPCTFDTVLDTPEVVAGYYRDIAVLAFPTPGDYRIPDIENKACYRTGFIYPTIVPDVSPSDVIDPSRIVDLTLAMDADGRLTWDVPHGAWTILRVGHTCTGVENMPSPPTGRGLECDKLSWEGIEEHFAGMIAKLAADVGTSALVATHIDSWENGAQNWTAHMRQEFQARRAYDLLPYLPVMTGRVVGSAGVSERFLWDLRHTVSDLLVENYAGHLATLAHNNGMRLTIEAYGGPCDDMPYAARADEPMSEFWVGGNALSVCKEMASAAHTYGKPILGAEAFTADAAERWQAHPASIKALGDEAFSLGVNRFVFHRYAMQPWLDRAPGMTMGPWGIHYERTQTWWEMTSGWHKYLSRCQAMLRRGVFVADICYMQPEAAPQGFHEHARGGYDYDNCSADVVRKRFESANGRLVLPDGLQYRLLVLPNVPTMTPQLLKRITTLVDAGATIIGPRPQQSPSLSGYPACDTEVDTLAKNLWGDTDGQNLRETRHGNGRVFWNVAPEEVLAKDGIQPDFASDSRLHWIHRADGDDDIYFVANPRPQHVTASCTFRVSGKVPELWWPESGTIEPAGIYAEREGRTTVALPLGPSASVFVVFRPGLAPADTVISLAHDGKTIASAVDNGLDIDVTRAIYGILDDPQRTRDVREKVQALVDNRDYSFSVARLAEGDDPAANTPKRVEIEYRIDDVHFAVSGDDPDTVRLTGDTAPITIEKAQYGILGDPQRTRDVRDKLQHLVNTGEMSFSVARMAQGDDPAVGIVKTLDLEYTVAGRRVALRATDSERVILYEAPTPEHIAGIVRTEEGAFLEAWRNGHYEVTMNSGNIGKGLIDRLPPAMDVGGPWIVRFDSNSGAPESLEIKDLVSLSELPEPGVHYYSGTMAYRTAFEVAPDAFQKDRRLYLDLGEVAVMAHVRLNGHDLGILWNPPFRVDVTDMLVPGENALEVDVANLWVNRLIGDEQLPDDSPRNHEGALDAWPPWVLDGEPSPTGRIAFSTWRLWNKSEPLPKSGLVGPVTVRMTQRIPLTAP